MKEKGYVGEILKNNVTDRITIFKSPKYKNAINGIRKLRRESIDKIAELAELSNKTIHNFVKDAVFNCILKDVAIEDYIEMEYNRLTITNKHATQ